ncbi:unnamed protein product [Periconia digitata]|uniref:Uncharacterized protein n=1 Tax=Periconia digitata TaxID=1303443 RepID=A0A9W4XXL5_9PLEO|nr:unnamed protein product [Periconia digitata]
MLRLPLWHGIAAYQTPFVIVSGGLRLRQCSGRTPCIGVMRHPAASENP